MRPMRSLDICFLPVCSLDRPVSTLDIQCAYWISSVLTGCPVSSLAYPVCTLGENPARFQCAYWTRLPVCTLDIQCTQVHTGYPVCTLGLMCSLAVTCTHILVYNITLQYYSRVHSYTRHAIFSHFFSFLVSSHDVASTHGDMAQRHMLE